VGARDHPMLGARHWPARLHVASLK
jgi:hypothetical protein